MKAPTKEIIKYLSGIGRKGGAKTAERGPDYFRKIQALRKKRGGGRPKKKVKT